MNNIDHSEYFHQKQVLQHAPPGSVIVEMSGNMQNQIWSKSPKLYLILLCWNSRLQHIRVNLT